MIIIIIGCLINFQSREGQEGDMWTQRMTRWHGGSTNHDGPKFHNAFGNKRAAKKAKKKLNFYCMYLVSKFLLYFGTFLIPF